MTSKPLENIARTAATRTAGRLRARSVLRSLTGHKRLSNCGFAAGQEVRLRSGIEGAGVAGLQNCGSVWSCPVCSAKIAMTRTDDMEAGIRHWAEHGGTFVMLTLTMRHHRGQSLRSLWDGLSGAWRRFVSDGTYKRTTKRLGVAGYHRTTEVTVGASGWHVHLHVVYFIEGKPGDLTSADAGGRLVARWMEAVDSEGFSAVADAQDWKILRGSPDALAAVAGYVHKGEYVERIQAVKPARSLAMEVTRSDLKAGRSNRTPFQLLADIVAEVESTGVVPEDDWALWSEWEEVSRGRRQQVWSRGMRSKLGLGQEMTDEEAAAVEVEGADLLIIPAEDWRSFASDGRRHAELLSAVEGAASGGFLAQRLAGAAVLRRYGCGYVLCDPPSIEGSGPTL